jgi:8-oxo-dGTP pyrophosphatase MutT (NUDIX family)
MTLQGRVIGYLNRETAQRLLARLPVLRPYKRIIYLDPVGCDPIILSEFFMEVAEVLAETNLIQGASDEQIGLRSIPFGPELAKVPRGVAIPLGLLMAGVHLNGYTNATSSGYIWVSRRNIDHHSFAGHIDNLAAGLLQTGQSIEACLWAEAMEEAGLKKSDVESLSVGSAYRYWTPFKHGIARGYIQAVHAKLPGTFIPQNYDGKTSSFLRLNLCSVLSVLDRQKYLKPVSCLAIMDFLEQQRLLAPSQISEKIVQALGRLRLVGYQIPQLPPFSN